MTRSRSMTFLAGAAVVPLAALAAGCGGSGGGGGAATAATPSSTPAATTAKVATIRVASSRLGKVLVNSHGRTLYLFKKDSGKKSACFGACATFWPPLRSSGKPTVGSGAKASLVGTTKRSDGKPQVTYNGHPLYTFVMDKKAGQTNGEGVTAFGGLWLAISPAGKQIPVKKKSSSASTSSSPPPATPVTPKPAAPKAAAPKPAAPAPAAPKPAPKPAAPAPPSNGIPQNNGGDHDSDNNGGPSDGDGNV
jgi:predicted lipoprotein with Yx(FWY)xxD motif